MLDFHSHILPCIDDGSQSIAESLQLLGALKKQGVHKVIATPHFYAHRESPRQFLQRRKESKSLLEEADLQGFPNIVLGAEVLYFDGISRSEELSTLKIEGTDLLLIEMPFSAWGKNCINEVLSINDREDSTIVLAHVERYLSLQTKDIFAELVKQGVKMQVNAEFLLKWNTKRRALNMIRNGMVHFLGSDCHNMTKRPPHIGEAMGYIQKKLGSSADTWFDYHEKQHFVKDEV